jgi:orotidine-5'-phosphate decarboxylase
MSSLADRIIVALDVENSDRALSLFDALRDQVGMFKIGSQLFTAAGPKVVRSIVSKGGHVFLDLKYHDIPNTVAAAGVEALRLGVNMFNVHAAGGREMMRQTVEAVSNEASRTGVSLPIMLGVTVLTSSDESTLSECGVGGSLDDQVVRLARLTAESGMNGVVASARETIMLRKAINSPGFVIVTPGVRPAGDAPGDQKRVVTPADAIGYGSDYLVIGRPITGAADPAAAARKILEEMAPAIGPSE